MGTTDLELRELFQVRFPRSNSKIEVREEQIQLAEMVEHTMDDGGVLIAEAGTGTGKSFAYLVPAIKKAVKGHQVVIVTATIALQHQLAERDIPQVITMLEEEEIPITVLKGRSNYLCRSRLENLQSSEESLLFKKEGLDEVSKWAGTTETGDKEEYSVYSSSALWKEICTHEYSCGGRKCQERGSAGCFYIHARRKAKQARVIITNYNLLACHLIAKLDKQYNTTNSEEETTSDGLLPDDAIFILDEAHNLKDIMRRSLTISLGRIEMGLMFDSLFGKRGIVTLENVSRGGFENSIQRLLDLVKQQFSDILGTLDTIDVLVLQIHINLEEYKYSSDIEYEIVCHANQNVLDNFKKLYTDLRAMVDVMSNIQSLFSEQDSIRETLSRNSHWWEKMCAIATIFSDGKKEEGKVRWCNKFTKAKNYSYSIAPLFVNDFLKKIFFSQSKAVVCTSATLSVQNKFEHWIKENGAPVDSNTIQLPSPFPYNTNVLMAIPTDAPSVNKEEKAYLHYLDKNLPSFLDVSEGHALVLCTSNNMVKTIYESLKKVEKKSKWNLLVQDNKTANSKLSKQFREDSHSVLIATNSFWEGFDAPGDTLKLLIITRLPFTSPSNLFHKEESAYLQSRGLNPFHLLSVPETELRLRQGFGRLMRSSTDSGVVLITDNRLHKYTYGKIIAGSLPSCIRRIDRTDAIIDEMRAHLIAMK